jgi:hypothetical protein
MAMEQQRERRKTWSWRPVGRRRVGDSEARGGIGEGIGRYQPVTMKL